LDAEGQGVVGRKRLEEVPMQKWEYLRVRPWASPGTGPEFSNYTDWQAFIRGQHFTGWDEIEKAIDDLGEGGVFLMTSLKSPFVEPGDPGRGVEHPGGGYERPFY